jgi:hypothetical protein
MEIQQHRLNTKVEVLEAGIPKEKPRVFLRSSFEPNISVGKGTGNQLDHNTSGVNQAPFYEQPQANSCQKRGKSDG